MLRLYNTVLLPFRVGAAFYAALRATDPDKRVEWAERRARQLPQVPPHGVWIHGASVGEARIVSSLARGIRSRRPDLPLAVSAYTATGRKLLPEPPQAEAAFFVPLDFPGLTTRLLQAIRPAALALVETELWPNLLHECQQSGTPVVVLNGRLSASRMARYRRFSALYRPLLEKLSALGAQSEDDARRFVELGVPAQRVEITGNVKYDLPGPDATADALREQLGLSENRPVFVAGSTAQGEDLPLLEAFQGLRERWSDLLLVLAPRHPERTDQVEAQARSCGLRTMRYSLARTSPGEFDVLLVDSVGHLSGLYQLASAAFVGGSLVPVGGHNLLEPAAVGVPVLYGPHTDNVNELVRELEQAGAGWRVRDVAELRDSVGQLLEDADLRGRISRAARKVVERNRGALDRSIRLLFSAVDGGDARSGTGAS